ncbi:hypothetical protein DFP72DRAFT_1064071 [Ephemerocybe angulata]|uniref:BTB domain-containing protein n=1 Tax=Ephemerocybe angulata TaxID=980116 RepID=A0A8H6M7V5_9AGAR|nr:hypothetical protein DFP72DRAFT_1064071 [Tulosesus angulatus]
MPFSAGPRPPRGFAAGVRPSPATNVRVTDRRQESYQFLTDAENTTIGELRSTNVGRDNITIMYNYRLQTPILRDILEHAGPAQERDILAHLPGVHPRSRPSRGEGNGWTSRNQPPPAPPWHQATSPSIPRGIAPPIWSPEFAEVADQKRLCISIEFGITSSTVAFCSPRINNGVVQQIIHWPGTWETLRKIPTCLIYDDEGRLLAWGLEAYSAPPIPGTTKCERFKLFLEPRLLGDESASDPDLPTLPPGKMPIDLIIDYLGCIYEYSKEQITRENGAVADLDTAEVWITVPAAWNTKGSEIMREAAITAGLVHSSRAGDTNWRDRLKIMSEPEAALTYCVSVADLHHLRPSQNIMVCNAGEGVMDLSVFKITGKLDDMEVAEVCTRSLAECGSSYLGMQFRELVKFLLSDHPIHVDPASLAYFQFSFDEVEKLAFAGGEDENKMFYFTCFNSEDPDDASVGLINGQLAIPGNLLKQQVFDPVVDQVIQAIEDQLVHAGQPVHALLLVGHLGESEFLKRETEASTWIQPGLYKRRFKDRIATITRPPEAGLGMVKGAAQFGLAKRSLVSSVIASLSYILKVDMPAEDEDWHKRPVYIKIYDSGETVCENRLEYLVTKGAIVPKGCAPVLYASHSLIRTYSRITSSLIGKDSGFVVTLYTSNSDQIMRYLDQGEVLEVCRWNVGLPSLQVLHPNATILTKPTIFPDLEIGLELDSLEARVILTYQGQEWGRTDTAATDNEEGMDERNGSEEIKQSLEYWFHDGSVVLQADSTQFKVHKAILERHSTIFKDVFAMPHPEGEPTVDGCALLHVQDSVDEIRCMLSALYDHSYNIRKPISFDMVKALIKMGTKYDIGQLRQEGFLRMRMEFPSCLLEYELVHFPPHGRSNVWKSIEYRSGVAFEVANFAFEHELTEILPTCYFFCITTHRDDLLDGIVEAGRRVELSPTVQRICLAGLKKLGKRYNTAFSWVDKFDGDNAEVAAYPHCDNPDDCLTNGKPLICALWRPQKSLAYMLYPWSKLRPRLEILHSGFNICASCLDGVEDTVDFSAEQIWNDLPSYFGLPSWKDLKKNTTLADLQSM